MDQVFSEHVTDVLSVSEELKKDAEGKATKKKGTKDAAKPTGGKKNEAEKEVEPNVPPETEETEN
jgi:hypothetical protein